MLQGKTIAAIIVAAGTSSRMGFDKLFAKINKKTVLEKSLQAFDSHPAIDEMIVVVGKNEAQVQPLLQSLQKPYHVVQGGAQRAQSVQNGIAVATTDYVAIHDAARPFVSKEVIDAALAAALIHGAAAPAVAVKDTIKVVGEGNIVQDTPNRETLFAVQTPQCFCTQTYREILQKMDTATLTDDCAAFEQAGLPVVLTQGSYSNYKITTKEDLPPQRRQEKMRIGHGYDVHKLVEGRALILGGVEIPWEKGLLGHSDADVLTHAIMDAMLGACALGDIGKLFPDNDAAYAGADSLVLLQKVAQVLSEKGFCVSNLDATMLCQRPKLAPHRETMRKNIAKAIGIEIEQVSIKATTEEGLGFTGAGEGIAAHCVCIIEKT